MAAIMGHLTKMESVNEKMRPAVKKLLKQNLLSKTFNLSEKESFLGNKPLKSTRLERIKNKLWRQNVINYKSSNYYTTTPYMKF